jgi:hypothetical protein
LNRVARDRVNHHSQHAKPELHAVLSGRGVTQVSSYTDLIGAARFEVQRKLLAQVGNPVGGRVGFCQRRFLILCQVPH